MSIVLKDCKRGRFLIRDNDRYLGRSLLETGEFGEGQVELFEAFITKEMVVVDAGANIGAHTVTFSRLAHSVHAFEPMRDNFHMLCGNVALNDLHNVACYHMALGEKIERRSIAILDTNSRNNFGGWTLDMHGNKSDEVAIIPLDIPCNFLKIDVEGHEIPMLKGAKPMLDVCKPLIYVENDRPDTADELIALIREYGYRPYWHVTPVGPKGSLLGDLSSIDMLCLPNMMTLNGSESAEAFEGDWNKKFQVIADNPEVANALE